MITALNVANIFSKLGNNSSLLPIAVKDGAHSLGMTTASYITGDKIEGKDRFIDEFGTQAIWIGGIPFYKKLIDMTLYKFTKQDPVVDVRLLDEKSSNILKKAIKHAPEGLEDVIKEASKHNGLFKKLAFGKFIASTFLTLASYWALTNFRHKHTEKNIIKEIKKEEATKKANLKFGQNKASNPTFKQHNPSFGMNMSSLKNFMFDPVRNMMIVDGGITAERLSESRNPQDFMGYVIKEGAFWGFMYFAQDKIKDFLEAKSAKSGKPIDLDIKVLQDPEFKNAFINEKLEKALNDFAIEAKSDEEIYEALFASSKGAKMSDNLIVKMAEKSGMLHLVSEKEAKKSKIEFKPEQIDTRKYVDIDGIKGLKKKIATLLEKAKGQSNLKEYIESLKGAKRITIIKSIGACIAALGVLVPMVILAMRCMDEDNKEFQVKKQLHEKLKQNNLV